ncbi:type IV secretion system protein [Qipengyuania marisflavi]|uniref:Type IV secretion system protein n=1 Tax=Qipengyuania marisflavi TaxID=2486356 RepID=A0A5S3P1K3_9SPHN|nr:type IV secretion system protein [Qipengyuania marisflavi]TMM46665.1 type IV secretion system protein [Qipengyuania marisflavi]
MSCPTIVTGDEFLLRVLMHIDCQSRQLGTFGYQSLADPGSFAAQFMAGLLTLFVALYGLRLLFGPGPGMRDTVMDVVKIGVVLTLAFSWPAWKTLVHDVVLDGPAQIAASIAPSSLSREGRGLPARLQAADRAMVSLTSAGTGRANGAILQNDALGGNFSGTALRDEEALGYARLFYLAGVIGSLALMRLAAGLLLALAPLAAGLLLFGATRGLFSGWLRGLVLTLLGTLGAGVVLAVELSVVEPWLADALRIRSLGYATPAAPIELFALTLAFALVLVGMVWLLGKIAFTRGWQDIREQVANAVPARVQQADARATQPPLVVNRAERISDSVALQMRHEERIEHQRSAYRGMTPAPAAAGSAPGDSGPAPSYAEPQRLGSSYRREARRTSAAGTKRDLGK